jgi:hypothetical protein
VRGQTEAPGEENGLVSLIVVGKPASVERHTEIVRRKLRESHQNSRGRPGGRPRTRGSAPPSNRIRITSTSRTRRGGCVLPGTDLPGKSHAWRRSARLESYSIDAVRANYPDITFDWQTVVDKKRRDRTLTQGGEPGRCPPRVVRQKPASCTSSARIAHTTRYSETWGWGTAPPSWRLARRLVTLDNLYCDGEVFEDGHQWSNAAYATDFTEKAWTNSYSNRGEPDADERLVSSPAGYLWDACAGKHLTLCPSG